MKTKFRVDGAGRKRSGAVPDVAIKRICRATVSLPVCSL